MSLQYSATVKFLASKTCFLSVPLFWRSSIFSSEKPITTCQIFYEGRYAFLSCKFHQVHSHQNQEEVYIDKRFADKLGLAENIEVFIKMHDYVLGSAIQVIVQPHSQDDWDILSHNTNYIERNLMNQIRVVWKDQVIPVWVGETHLVVKIENIIPDIQPAALLQDTTEVKVEFIKDAEMDSSDSSIEKRKKDKHLQYKHLRKSKSGTVDSTVAIIDEMPEWDNARKQSSNTGNGMFSYITSVFMNQSKNSSQTSIEEPLEIDFFPLNFEAHLRVMPFTKDDDGDENVLPFAVQATTVFISASTYISVTGEADVPPCFVARLAKCFSPIERKQKKQEKQDSENSAKSPENENSSKSKNKRKRDEIGHKIRDEQDVFDSVCVNVVVLQSADEDEYNVPKSLFYTNDLIVVPRELKQCLNLQVSTIVHCKSVQTRPTVLQRLVFHPVSSQTLHYDVEKIKEAFVKWTEESNLEDSSLVISSGTLVSLQFIKGREKSYFFVNCQENSDISSIKSPSSVGSLSPTSPESDKSASFRSNKQSAVFDIDPQFGYLNKNIVRKLHIKIGNLMASSVRNVLQSLFKTQMFVQNIPTLELEALGGINEIADQAMADIEFWLKLRPLSYTSNHPSTSNGCLLICGPKGVGKTTFAKAICKKLAVYPYYVYVDIVECLPLRGRKVESIVKSWDIILMEAIHRQPSILLFEDLDYIASSPATPEQAAAADGLYFSSIVYTFINFMRKIIESEKRIVVLVTSKSTHSLHSTLTDTKGRHVFQTVLEIKPPSVLQREEILKAMILTKKHISTDTLNFVSLNELALKTDGYYAQDLDSLIDKAVHAAWLRNEPNEKVEYKKAVTLTINDFEEALEGYVPSSLRGIPLHETDKKKWSDIGGLHEVKNVIQQIITWPVKYKSLFKNYALKPQSNILLYGAPGTGKTLLASVVAHECGLNFISIKGPELLSKYIGASEQAVRDLFQRAISAKPCILFFDEFDSIAPRRGHDSTGVTDRVVNQLLTQLDGVESLEGVHVLGATSRPELIDPALLRPGRFDKCVLCPLPDENERLEILKCLSSKLPLHDVDFEQLVPMTEYFSGADLQALLYSAHIAALNDIQSSKSRSQSMNSEDITSSIGSKKFMYIPSLKEGAREPTNEEEKKIMQEVDVIINNHQGVKKGLGRHHRHSTLTISIEQQHLLNVVSEMKPSVSQQERFRYEQVFERFQNTSGKRPSTVIEQGMQRVTLA